LNTFFTSTNTVYSVGSGSGGDAIRKSTDGGYNWSVQYTTFQRALKSIFFTDANTGYVVGEAGIIIKTTDGGNNWNGQNSGTNQNLWSVFFSDVNTGFAVGGLGGGGVILKTTDGGDNWETQVNGITEVTSVYFANANAGYIVGLNGTILATTNGGNDWNLQVSGTNADLWSVYFLDESTGYITGEIRVLQGGIILKTTDSGSTWFHLQSASNFGLFSIFFTDSEVGYAVGKFGTILKTTSGGVSFVEGEEIDEIPTSYNLSQNYPNPFNPTTSIQYAVSSMQFVSIKVYDVLGNEITTLVNEEKPTGIYEVEFNTLDLPSGIYFYKIQAGNFIETKKMVLMK